LLLGLDDRVFYLGIFPGWCSAPFTVEPLVMVEKEAVGGYNQAWDDEGAVV
jgi:hypothetical protein